MESTYTGKHQCPMGTAFTSRSWQIEGTPRITSQDIEFTNGDMHLSGTVYLPVEGKKMSGPVVLHGAEAPKRNEKLYPTPV